MNLGRDKLDWSQDIWKQIDNAVHDEAQRIRIAMKFIPIYMTTSDALTVPADTIDPTTLTVDEGASLSIFEILVGFSMTQQQVSKEGDVSTAVTLATRATNLLAQAEDVLIFQGDDALERGGHPNPLFTTGRVRHRNSSFGKGLLGAVDPSQIIEVDPVEEAANPAQNRYGENTFGAVAKAYSLLQSKGHYGPYALVLHSDVYADTYAPLKTTLIMPADRIKPLITAGFYGTGTLTAFTGVLVSLGGNSMDLAVGMDAMTAFLQEDTAGLSQFRVYERFVLRLKDPTAIVELSFKHKKPVP